MMGKKVSILDQDFDGYTIPKMYGVMGKNFALGKNGLIPVEGLLGIQIVSMGAIVNENEVVTMFHELRRATTEEFLSHVDYGERDFLIIDLPPGTSSDAANLMQYIPDLNGTIIVTMPPYVSQLAARKASLMSIKTGVKVLGILENMSECICDKCGHAFNVLAPGGGRKLADELSVPFLGSLPLNAEVSEASDAGVPFVYKYPNNVVSKALTDIAAKLESDLEYEMKSRQKESGIL
jgi:Mrp family chromosome partitioning ATPase